MKKERTLSKIILSRKNEWVNMSEKYEVYVNNKKKAELDRGAASVVKVTKEKVRLLVKMDGGYTSEEIKINPSKGQDIKIKVSGFKFQEYILPYFAIVIPLFVLLRESHVVSPWMGIPLILPVAAYAFYYYVWRRDRSLRIEVLE